MPAALYQSPAVRGSLGPALRPGGEALTRRILELTRPGANQLILDAGCGPGASLGILGLAGFNRVLGLDCDRGLLAEAAGQSSRPRLVQADLSRLPIADRSIDMILCECVWNLTPRGRVLAEFARVLRPGGTLAIADIYTRAPQASREPWPVPCCFAGATDLGSVRDLVIEQGFQLTVLEDHSRLLRETAARFVFEYGSLHGFWFAVTGDDRLADQACRAAAAKPGLFLLIAHRQME